jgi:hypothetical protein
MMDLVLIEIEAHLRARLPVVIIVSASHETIGLKFDS